MSTISRYWDKYKERHRAESTEKSDLSKLASDKQAYISFLEVQLERVTQTVLTTQGFSDRIENLQTQLNSSDEKILNLTRLVKLQQTFAETQEQEITSLKHLISGSDRPIPSLPPLNNLDRRVKIIEDKLENPATEKGKLEDFAKEIDSAVKKTEFKITELVSRVTQDIENKQKALHREIEETLDKYSRDFEESYQELSRKVYGKSENEGKTAEKKHDKKINDRVSEVETGLRDLEQFLVAIAEEVKKLDQRQKENSEFELKISSKLNSKMKKLSDALKKSLNLKTDPIRFTPVKKEESHVKQESFIKESPKFPLEKVEKKQSPGKEKPKPRSPRSKSPNSKSSQSKSPKNQSKSSQSKSPNRSKSPKSVTSRSRKSSASNKSNNTRKSKHSDQDFISPSTSPKATTKSKAMQASIKAKLQKMKVKDQEEKKAQLKNDQTRRARKTPERKSKLDKLYQELSNRPN